jgi:hypothetical protein
VEGVTAIQVSEYFIELQQLTSRTEFGIRFEFWYPPFDRRNVQNSVSSEYCSILEYIGAGQHPQATATSSEESGGESDLLAHAQPINGYQADLGLGVSPLFFFCRALGGVSPWAPTTIHALRRPTERRLPNIFSDPLLNPLCIFHQIFLTDLLAKPVALVESRRPAAAWRSTVSSFLPTRQAARKQSILHGCMHIHGILPLPTDFVPALDVV